MKNLSILSGSELAKYFNSLDYEKDFAEHKRVESELNFRYYPEYINSLLSVNK